MSRTTLISNFQWELDKITQFGGNYLPLAMVKIQSNNGKWRRFTFKIDSGADVTLMRMADCVTLGYSLRDCIQAEFLAANNTTITTYIKQIDMKIGDYVLKDVPVAFSERPVERLLLGRLGIFEKFNIEFRGSVKQTLFSA